MLMDVEMLVDANGGQGYRRFIAGPTLNNFFFKLNFPGNYHLMLLKM